MKNKNRYPTPPRSAFTLIELLLVIAIIAVLSTLAVSVISSAQQDARVAATRARVALIQSAMELELEDFEVRRSPISFGAIGQMIGNVDNAVWANSEPPNADMPNGGDNFLLHAKNLKRMIVADLIRSEFPSGRGGEPARLGSFPSQLFTDYLVSLGIGGNEIARTFRRVQPANVTHWRSFGGFTAPAQNPSERQQLIDSAEALYEILSSLDFDGTNVVDALGTAAIGDIDSDGFPEIVDAFGDPMSFEFHQRNIVPTEGITANTVDRDVRPQSGVWVTPDGQEAMINFEVINPVLPTDLRFFVTSPTLFEIDGPPLDLQ